MKFDLIGKVVSGENMFKYINVSNVLKGISGKNEFGIKHELSVK